MSAPSPKSPLVAALISLVLPGFGHFYAGAWLRGLGVMIFLYAGFFAAPVFLGSFGLMLAPVLSALAAWDAWRMAELANARLPPGDAAELPASAGLRFAWAAARSLWLTPLLLFGLFSLVGAALTVRHGGVLLALLASLPALGFLALVWFAARDTWRGLRGLRPVVPAYLRAEVNATVGAAVILALGLAVAWPRFQELLRFSGEGAMKGNLADLRQRILAYRGDHDGAFPPTLETLIVPKISPHLPVLWSNSSVGAHAKTTESIVVAERTGADTGKWAYVVAPSTPELHGTVFIDCTHTDARGSAWTSY